MNIKDELHRMIVKGACMQHPAAGGPVLSIAGAHWEAPNRFRWCPMFPEDQHNIKFVEFDEFIDNGTSVMFLKNGNPVACAAPYDDWPLFDVDKYIADRGTWRTMMSDPAKAEEFEHFLRTS